ncbi:MAG: hypothetical protein F6K39_46485, partial [Okeania sp. SIO3B3]|nr:hypothetical protein [Okeania sp. SIO3B3]
MVNDVVVRGRYAYLASGSAGLQIVDTESPELSLVGQVDTAGYALSLDVIGDYAYLADELYGLCIIDVSTPTRPQEVGFYDPVQPAEHVIVADEYAYTLDGGAMRIVDVSIPTQPVEVGLFQTIGLPVQVIISEQHAYVINERQAI